MKTQYPLDIVIFCSGLPFTGQTIEKGSIGGSETAALQMAESLAKLGNNVSVYSHCKGKEGKYNNVTYIDINKFYRNATQVPHDILIIQRAPDMFRMKYNSKLNFLWTHDLVTVQQSDYFRATAWNIDKCLILSDFHKKQSQGMTGLPDDYYWQTKNGIDHNLVGNPLKRDPKKLIFGARPERGLDNLLFSIFPAMLEKDKDLKLYITSYNHDVEAMQGYYDSLRQQANNFKDNVVWLAPQTKAQLYEHYKTASLFLYPQDFEETSCISAIEAQACSLPIICNDVGAVRETIDIDSGVVLSGFDSARNSQFSEQFVDISLTLLNNPERLKEMGQAGIKNSQNYKWDNIAKDWNDKFFELFKKYTENKYTLVQDLIFHSDIVAAKKIVNSLPNGDIKEILTTELKPWNNNFKDDDVVAKVNDDGFNDYFNDIKGMKSLKDITVNKREPHWPMLDMWLKQHPEVKNFLDYGSFTGRYALPLANTNEDYKVTMVDISNKALETGKQLADDILKYDNVDYVHSNYKGLSKKIKYKVDCILLNDVLEHIPNPVEAIDELEKCLTDDGWMLIITPFGAMEANSYDKWTDRIHVHEFDKHDLMDMFGKKRNRITTYLMNHGYSEIDRSVFGKFFTQYQKSEVKTGKINYNRKFLVRNPKQTITACMMVKDCENELGKCLASIRPYVNEIIVCDTGSIDGTKEVARRFRAKIIDGSDPLKYGFETSRNESIAQALGDWIMWIDDDEELLEGSNIGKFLKQNCFNGYSLRQHHLSVIPPNAFKPDLPVRIFRNNKDIKFYGIIHEHPEEIYNEGIAFSTIINDADIAHTGYYVERIRRERFARNFPLFERDRKKYPERILGNFFEIRENMHLVKYDQEQNRGNITAKSYGRCKKAVALTKKHFLGNNMHVSGDSLDFYSQANMLLGQGFNMSIAFGFGKDQSQLANNAKTIQFESIKDAQLFASNMIQEGAGQYMSKYY